MPDQTYWQAFIVWAQANYSWIDVQRLHDITAGRGQWPRALVDLMLQIEIQDQIADHVESLR